MPKLPDKNYFSVPSAAEQRTPRVDGWLPTRGKPHRLRCGTVIHIDFTSDWDWLVSVMPGLTTLDGNAVRPKNRRPKPKGRKPNLTPDVVREIRLLYDTGEYTQVALANKYGLTGTSIYKIVHRRSWADI